MKKHENLNLPAPLDVHVMSLYLNSSPVFPRLLPHSLSPFIFLTSPTLLLLSFCFSKLRLNPGPLSASFTRLPFPSLCAMERRTGFHWSQAHVGSCCLSSSSVCVVSLCLLRVCGAQSFNLCVCVCGSKYKVCVQSVVRKCCERSIL